MNVMGFLMEEKTGDVYKTYDCLSSTSWKRAICDVTAGRR